MSVQNEIMKTIEIMVNKAIDKRTPISDKASVVLEIKNNKYRVNIDGADYWLKDGVNINPTVGMRVWVRIPHNRMHEAYICAKA